jgi:hypothetical protein
VLKKINKTKLEIGKYERTYKGDLFRNQGVAKSILSHPQKQAVRENESLG